MDDILRNTLAHLIRKQRYAALGTLRSETPFISMILYVVSPDFQSFYTLISGLAHHTQDIQRDPRVGLMLVEEGDEGDDPQQRARISINGEAVKLTSQDPDYEMAKELYLAKYPQTAFNLTLKDFSFYRISPRSARFVAGFAQAFNLSAADLREISAAMN